MSEPFVSVVIPCFNTRDCVAHAINSALAQQEISVEVIVVDDGSTDGTPEFVRDAYAGDDRVRPFRMPVNGGPSAARNLGFRQARGTWTALLDSDDTWRENRLLRLLRHGHEADFIADNLMSFDAVARVETRPVYDDPHDRFLSLTDFLLPTSHDRHDFGYLQPIMRTEFLRRHGIAYREDVRAGEDLLLNLRIVIEGGRAFYVGEPLYIYQTPVGAISRNASPYARSVADTRPLIAALEMFGREYQSRLSEDERQALDLRISNLRANVAVGRFHRAKASGRYVEMMQLMLTQPSVWQKAVERVMRKS